MTPCTPGPVAKCSASATGHASGARCLSLQPSNLNDLRWRSGVPSISAAGRPQSASRHNSALRWQSLGPRSRGGRDSQLRQPRQLRFLDHLDLQHRQHDDRGGSSYGSETASSSGGANGVQHGSGADGYPDGGGAAALRFENSYGASGGTVGHLNVPARAGALLQDTISALNVMATGDLSAMSDSDLSDSENHWEPHEDISPEYQPTLAATVGRAFYEVLRVDKAGKTNKLYIKRRDLLRRNRLLPRDLRRIDPSLSVIKTSPSITVKDHALLVNLGGVRMILSADKALLFEPSSPSCRRWQDLVLPRLAASDSERAMRALRARGPGPAVATESTDDGDQEFDVPDHPPPPFELELLEAALMVATNRLDEELMQVTQRMQRVLRALPSNVNPVNLEELRRVKQLLVELESKADMLRNMLEELMDDQEDIGDINLSSRPKREESRRQRDRDALEREMEREAERESALATVTPDGTLAFENASESDSPTFAERANKRRSYDQEDEEGTFDNAEDALARLVEREEAEREAEEVEDLLEYYMQRAATLQSESERLLAGARDLEESIGVSLSARRFEVQRLELTLSIGSFAAALGAVVAGIFGMNLKSTFEESIIGFWGGTAAIVLGCLWVFWAIYRYVQKKRIL
mmetsp:Transcript_10253/g.30884  ORF Transcript_10253/g.30884 Transcript_10253/m.30884 type:complete len:640 (+) Transcript_10253:142-2061(+)